MSLDRMQSGSRQISWRRYDGGLVYIETRDRSDMAKVLESQRELFDSLRQQVQDAELPPDLAFITLVESEFKPKVRSRTNNAGLWQLEPITARLHGLKVNSKSG